VKRPGRRGSKPPADEVDTKEVVRRQARAPSVVLGSKEERARSASAPAHAGDEGLSRAERRRRRLQASERDRDLNDRQRSLLGLDADPSGTGAATPLPDAAPAAPRRPPPWQRHDLLVVGCAALVALGGGLAHHQLTIPTVTRFERLGLALDRPAGWPRPTAVPAPPLRLAPDAPLDQPAAAAAPPFHVVFRSPLDPLVTLELEVEARGDLDNPRAAIALARAARYGESYWADESENHNHGGRDWVRTRFRYATKVAHGAPPVLGTGIEYAAVAADRLYLVTFHGGDDEVEALEELIAPSLVIGAPGSAR
jgi:hypothetical protein